MYITYFAEVSEEASGLGALGVSLSAFIVQLITFVFVFLILKRFAFDKIGKMLETRRKTIDDGVRLGQKLEKEREDLDKEVANILRDARHEADKIIATGHKEAREVVREAEKTAHRKSEAMIAEAEVRIQEESRQAKRKLEKDIVGLVSEATEAIVHEKVDAKKDAELIDKAIRGRK